LLSVSLLFTPTYLSLDFRSRDGLFSGSPLIFTARRVCIARTMPWQDVYPSVCPSHVSIVSKRLYISSKFFNVPPF